MSKIKRRHKTTSTKLVGQPPVLQYLQSFQEFNIKTRVISTSSVERHLALKLPWGLAARKYRGALEHLLQGSLGCCEIRYDGESWFPLEKFCFHCNVTTPPHFMLVKPMHAVEDLSWAKYPCMGEAMGDYNRQGLLPRPSELLPLTTFKRCSTKYLFSFIRDSCGQNYLYGQADKQAFISITATSS